MPPRLPSGGLSGVCHGDFGCGRGREARAEWGRWRRHATAAARGLWSVGHRQSSHSPLAPSRLPTPSLARLYATAAHSITEEWNTGPPKPEVPPPKEKPLALASGLPAKGSTGTPFFGANTSSTESAKEKLLENGPALRNSLGGMLDTAPPRLFATGPQKMLATVLDSKGVVRQVAAELPKTELLAKLGIEPRDLRKVDSTYSHQSPAILVRTRAIIVCLLHARAIITAEQVYIIPPPNVEDSGRMNLLLYEIESAARNTGSKDPFELRVLEAVLVSVVRTLARELEEVHVARVGPVLEKLEEKVEAGALKELLVAAKEFSVFGQRLGTVQGAVAEVLNSDEDLAGLFLTAKDQDQPRAVADHWEAELLLEAYLAHLTDLSRRHNEVRDQMKHTEEVAGIVLDSVRNDLLVFEIRLVTATTGLASGSLLASFFGMNMPNTFESSTTAFLTVVVAGSVIAGTVWLTLRRQLGKITVSGLGKDWARREKGVARVGRP